MSAAIISSLVRCGERDRMHEKRDKTPQKRSTVFYEEQKQLDTHLYNMNFPKNGESEWEQLDTDEWK